MVRHATYAVLASLALAIGAFGPADAFETKAFDDQTFKTDQAAGKSIVVDVFAPWCPTCKAQHQVFDTLKDKPEYANVIFFKVDFDSQKDVLKALKAQSQSTLIAFKGEKETARSAGETNAAKIEALIASTLK